MIVLCTDRNTISWRRAHRGKVSASDARGIMAEEGTKARRELVERLVLDREGIVQHEDEEPSPWHTAHEAAVRSALAAYRRDIGPIEPAPLAASEKLSWLIAGPHGLAEGVPVLFRSRESLHSFHQRAGRLDRATITKARLTAFVFEAPYVIITDYYDGMGEIPDRLKQQWVAADEAWLQSRVFPKLVAVWGAVGSRLRERSAGAENAATEQRL